MYSPKKTSSKIHYSAFCPNYYATNEKTQDFSRFQYEREDYNFNNENSKFKKFNQSFKDSPKKAPYCSQTSKSHIFSMKDHRYYKETDQGESRMTNSSSASVNSEQAICPKNFKYFAKQSSSHRDDAQFYKFLQMAKRQKERFVPPYSLMFTHKAHKPLHKTQNLIVEELRQTEDTIPQNQQYMSQSPPKASDFHQVRLLGKGKNGEVYLAIHKATGFACAMKIIKKSDINKGTASERKIMQNQLLRQIKVQLYMCDPNLIELYAVFSDKDNIYLIQQLGIDGQLYDLMRKKFRFSEQSTALVGREILKGLKYMHSKQIIHRDIKPENIVLIYGIAKLCDFGWSVHCPLELRSTLCGTPLYLSPQVLIGDQYNEKIDIWAYGTLVYELFTGDNPFQVKSRCDLKKIVTDELDFANNFPRRLRAFLQSILKKKFCERPTALELEGHEFLRKYAELQTSQELANL